MTEVYETREWLIPVPLQTSSGMHWTEPAGGRIRTNMRMMLLIYHVFQVLEISCWMMLLIYQVFQVLEISCFASCEMCIFSPQNPKVPVKSQLLLHTNITGSSEHSCILLTVHLVLFYSLLYITWCLLLCKCTESCLGQINDVNCAVRWSSHI